MGLYCSVDLEPEVGVIKHAFVEHDELVEEHVFVEPTELANWSVASSAEIPSPRCLAIRFWLA